MLRAVPITVDDLIRVFQALPENHIVSGLHLGIERVFVTLWDGEHVQEWEVETIGDDEEEQPDGT